MSIITRHVQNHIDCTKNWMICYIKKRFENLREQFNLLGLYIFYLLNEVIQDGVAFMSQPYWVQVEVKIEAEIYLSLRLNRAQVEVKVEMKLSWNLVEFELNWAWVELRLNWGHKLAFIGLGLWFKNIFRSTDKAEEHLFPSHLTFNLNPPELLTIYVRKYGSFALTEDNSVPKLQNFKWPLVPTESHWSTMRELQMTITHNYYSQ